MMGNWRKKRDDENGLVWKLFEDIGNVGPALGLGAGCGFGFGAGLTGGYGPGLPKLQFGVGFGTGCGIGVGLGFGVGRGAVFDHARAFNNVVDYLWWKLIGFAQGP
ncbi:protein TRIGALACTOSYLDIACYLGLYCEROL 5, chloroplastic [Brassica rapa]|uniref:Glycine-rich protein n=2 Tax=Brassica campestris TaxID=3711 RepID=A0A8D9HF63_BRACM|nr:protein TRIGALACTOSYLDIACYLGLYCEROL 5, chloroplastic [Brassica rapa]CAG7896736.1 unnamed protein product [Brassica rapa]